MASKLAASLGSFYGPKVPGLSESTPQYQTQQLTRAAKNDSDRSGWINGIMTMVEKGPAVYDAYKKEQADAGEKKYNEIISKLSPAQIQEAYKSGTLYHQDDEYAMQKIRQQAGANAAFEADRKIADGIKRGEYTDRVKLDEARMNAQANARKDTAAQYGFDENDEYFKLGWSGDAEKRNAATYDVFNKWESANIGEQKAVQDQKTANTLANQPGLFASDPSVLGKFVSNVRDSPAKIMEHVGTIVQGVAGRGDRNDLAAVLDSPIEIGGLKTTAREQMGPAAVGQIELQADQVAYQRDYTKTQADNDMLAKLSLTSDPTARLANINAQLQQAELEEGSAMTTKKEKLLALQKSTNEELIKKTEKSRALLDLQKQDDALIDDIVMKFNDGVKQGGELVSMNRNDYIGPDGKIVSEDVWRRAQQAYLNKIDALGLPPEDLMRVKLNVAQVMGEGSTASNILKPTIDAGKNYIAQAIPAGKVDESNPAFANLWAMYQQNPSLVSSLDPETGKMLNSYAVAKAGGVSGSDWALVQGSTKALNPEQLRERESKWADAATKSETLKYIPGSTQPGSVARQVYDARIAKDGNAEAAIAEAENYVKDNFKVFTSDDIQGTSYGIIPKHYFDYDRSRTDSITRGGDLFDELVQNTKDSIERRTGRTSMGSVTVEGDKVRYWDALNNEGIVVSLQDLRDYEQYKGLVAKSDNKDNIRKTVETSKTIKNISTSGLATGRGITTKF